MPDQELAPAEKPTASSAQNPNFQVLSGICKAIREQNTQRKYIMAPVFY